MAKLIEVQRSQLIAIEQQVLWREVPMSGSRCPARNLRATLSDAAEDLAIEASGFGKCLSQVPPLYGQSMEMAAEIITPAPAYAACMELEQPLSRPRQRLRHIRTGKK